MESCAVIWRANLKLNTLNFMVATVFKVVWFILAVYGSLRVEETMAHLKFPMAGIFPDELKACTMKKMREIFGWNCLSDVPRGLKQMIRGCKYKRGGTRVCVRKQVKLE